jgi:hypothetical protein
MSGNNLWNARRVEKFMRELKLVPTKWEDNIATLAKTAQITVEEFLTTDPITFSEKIWGKDSGYDEIRRMHLDNLRTRKILGDSVYHEMLHQYDYREMMRYYGRTLPADKEVEGNFWI